MTGIIVCVLFCAGQDLNLRSSRLGAAPYTAYYLTGQSTSQIGLLYLPSCQATDAAGSLIQLTNTNTGVVAGQRNQSFDNTGTTNSVGASWDFTLHSTLNSNYTGLYRCTSDITSHMTATQTYQLHVVGEYFKKMYMYTKCNPT